MPKKYRFEGAEVFIRNEGKALIIEPKSKRRWPRDFFKRIGVADRRFGRLAQGRAPLPAAAGNWVRLAGLRLERRRMVTRIVPNG